MKKNYNTFVSPFFAFLATGFLFYTNTASAQTIQTFSYTGAVQNFTVPGCVTTMTIMARGAQGGAGSNAAGGLGASASGVIAVTPGQVLAFYVGGQNGYNGGGTTNGNGGNGGGASDVRILPGALADRVMVAGGGGGAGGGTNGNAAGGIGGGGTASGANGFGGAAGLGFPLNMGTDGGTNGGAGGTGNGNRGGSGGGGGLLSGGGGGTNTGFTAGGSGSVGIGGSGTGPTISGGGGGGGYYGGGGGSGANNNAEGGGGGSSWTGALSSPSFVAGNRIGDGTIIITYISSGVSVSASPSVICAGGTATLIANSQASYTWSNGSNASSITVAPSSTTSYTVQGTNSSGCVSSAVLNLSVNTSTPSLAISSSTPSTCFGNTLILTASGAYTYTWSNGISNGLTYTPTTQGVNTYTVQGSNACGTSSAVTSVTLNPLPINVLATSTLVCAGTQVTLTANGATTYTWLPLTTPGTGPTHTVSPSVTSIYTVTGKTGPCSNSVTFTVSTNPNPIVAIAPSSTAVCEGDVVTLTVTGDASTFSWSPGGQTGSTISDSPLTVTVYSVVGTSTANCSSSAQQIIFVNPLPTLSIAASNPLVCSGGASTLSASGASTYLWTGGSNAATSSMVVNPVSDETYTVTGTSSLSCSSSTVISVSVFVPVISVSSGTAICMGSSAGLSAGVADSYSWSNGQSIQNITVSPTLTTIYTLTASVNNFNGLNCPATNSVEVTVNPNPVLSATASPSAICVGMSSTLTASGAGATGTYTWIGGAGPVTSASVVVMPIAAQVYTVTGVDANGCKGKALYQLVVAYCPGIHTNSLNVINLLAYPNPGADELTIAADQAIDLQIINELGQPVRTAQLDKNNREIKLSLPAGVYFIIGANENGAVKQKVVITN